MKRQIKEHFIEFMLSIGKIIKYQEGVPVLLYHRVLSEPYDSPVYAISTRTFKEQMEYLYSEGYRTISCSELIKYIKGEAPLQPKSVVITFDDGFRDNYEAIKLAGKYGFNSVLFIATEFIGREYDYVPFFGNHSKDTYDSEKSLIGKVSFLTELQLKELRSMGTEVYPHTVNHRNLVSADYEEQRSEIVNSHKKICDMLGGDSKFFCYPYGMYNENTIKILSELGYCGAFAVKDGLNRKGDDVFALKRHNAAEFSMPYFQLLLTEQFAWYHKISSLYKRKAAEAGKCFHI